MKTLLIALLAIASCANNEPAFAEETEPAAPCHEPIKIVDTGAKLIFITNCQTESPLEFVKPVDGNDGEQGIQGETGERGSSGGRGPTGSTGPQGPSAEEIFGVICNHGRDHIDRTLSISTSELVFSKWGVASEFDYPGPCENSGQCSCDQCPRFANTTESIKILHRDLHLMPLWDY